MSQFAEYPSLRDRVAFISGGASGIGADLVRHFSAQRTRAVFVDIDDDAAQALAAEVAAAGHPPPRFVHCDVRDVDALQIAVRAAGDEVGPVTILVNNAANDHRGALDEVTPATCASSVPMRSASTASSPAARRRRQPAVHRPELGG